MVASYTPHADGWFTTNGSTRLSTVLIGGESARASLTPDTGYDTRWFESDDSEYLAIGRNL